MNASIAGTPSATPSALLLQDVWDAVRARDVLQSRHLPAAYALLTHVLLSAPFLALDALAAVCPRVQGWRLAAGSGPPPSAAQWLRCLGRLLLRYAAAVVPATALLQSLGEPELRELPELAPSCWRLCAEVAACLLLFDALFFAWHLAMHRVPWLYVHVHRQHHQQQLPFALAAQDASWVELLSLLLLALASARLLGCHPLSEVVFHLLNSWLAVEDHCGYDLPWALSRVLPFLGGAPHHQAHHGLYGVNFAPYFTHWDQLFGTYRSTRKD